MVVLPATVLEKHKQIIEHDNLIHVKWADIGKQAEALRYSESKFAGVVREACKYDFHLFLYLCCSEIFWGEPGFSHFDFIQDVDRITRSTTITRDGKLLRPQKRKLNYISHRGSVKTTLAVAYVVYQIVYKRERFIVLGGSDDTKVSEVLKNVDSLLTSPIITSTFQPAILKSNSKGITANGIRVIPRSIRQNWRGLNYLARRPTLIILDDIQSEEMCFSAKEREDTWITFSQAIEPCGPPEKFPIQVTIMLINTALHPESIPVKLRNKKDFDSKVYPAIVSEPKREDLWKEYDRLYLDSAEIEEEEIRLGKAESFYLANKAEMDRGITINWRAGTTYNYLRRVRLINGLTAFNREYQGNPVDVTKLVFANYLLDGERVKDDILFKIDENRMLKYGKHEYDLALLPRWAFFDGAEGKPSGCYASMIVLAHKMTVSERKSVGNRLDVVTGLDFVLDNLLMKEPPEVQAEKILLAAFKWNIKHLVVESSTFQNLYAPLLAMKAKELKAEGRLPKQYKLTVIPMAPLASMQSGGKLAAIETTIISLGLGFNTLKFNANLNQEFWTQMTQFPTASFVDAPDSLAAGLYYYYRYQPSNQADMFNRQVQRS